MFKSCSSLWKDYSDISETYLLCKCQLSCKASLGHFIRCSYSATMVSMRRERAEKQGLVLPLKINGFSKSFFFFNFFFSVMQSIPTALLCCQSGIETHSISVLLRLFSPLMLNLTSEKKKKKRCAKKDLPLKNRFSCSYANNFILEILQILSSDRFIYGLFTYVSVRVSHFYLTEEFDLWVLPLLGIV